MKKLAIITTHPIQYYAPIFALLHQRKRIAVKVFYTLGQQVNKTDQGFNQAITWDIPLLSGYDFEWLKNVAPNPGSHHFKGIVTPDAVKQIEAWQPNALLVFGWAYQSHLKIIRHFSGKIPVYFRGDSTLLNVQSGLKKTMRWLFLRWVYRHIDHAFYVGENNKAYFKEYGLKDAQLSFAPHAIDNERFSQHRANEVYELRSVLNIGPDEILILYAGKFEEVKNVGLLLAAFINLNKQNVHLLLAGTGLHEASLKEQAGKSPVADNIHFLGFKNQSYMPVLYQAADLFCLPSKSETWGLSINEAMACGKAIIASDKVGCVPDLVKTGENGAVFPSDDVDALTRHLLQLTDKKATLQQLGARSGIMIKKWNFVNIAAAIENKLQ